jgi:hypothetical protein
MKQHQSNPLITEAGANVPDLLLTAVDGASQMQFRPKIAMNRLATRSCARTFFTGRENDGSARADRPEEADRKDGEEQSANVQRRAHQLDRGVNDVPVEWNSLCRRWSRGYLSARKESQHCNPNRRSGCDRRLRDELFSQEPATENR